MNVQVNGQTITIFNGALVRDAVLHYSQSEYRQVMTGEKAVSDGEGNRVHLDGALVEGDVLITENIS